MMPLRRRQFQRGQSVVEFALVAPLMIFMMFALLDLARIYTTMMSVESAAREAADYGTTLGAERWSVTNTGPTLAEMERRACVAASDLPDYAGIDTDANGIDESCSNPTFASCLRKTSAGPCLAPTDVGYDCDDPENNDPVNDPPCTVTVTLRHVFHLFIPFEINFFGVTLGLPTTLTFDRDSTFAMTDITVVDPTAPPTAPPTIPPPPTETPTETPTESPTTAPTESPSAEPPPTDPPTAPPTESPTAEPRPTDPPTAPPTDPPADPPTAAPTDPQSQPA